MVSMNFVKNPILFQGRNKTKRYFEGWYYKLVNRKANTTLALIPGISLEETNPHAFIQVIFQEGKSKHPQTWYCRFEKADFHFQDHPFMIDIGGSRFFQDRLELDIHEADIALSGVLTFTQMTPIKTKFGEPSIMGPYAYLSFMECFHGVLSMNHVISGSLIFNSKTIDFTNGKGYLEKDWGISFPKQYVWMQSNHFPKEDVSLMASVAHIPFLVTSFEGFIVNLTIGKDEYRFATYNGATKKRITQTDQEVRYVFKRGSWSLEVHAWSDTSVALKAPKEGQMDHVIKEGISGKIAIVLRDKETVIFEGVGERAGIEIAMLEKAVK